MNILGDNKQILEDLGGITEQEYKEFVKAFVSNCDIQIIKLKKALKKEDYDTIFQIAHNIKGEALTLALNEIGNLLNNLRCESEQNRNNLSKVLNIFEKQILELKKKLTI